MGRAGVEPRPSSRPGRRFRGPFARYPRTADAALAVVHLLGITFLTEGPGDSVVLRDVGDVPPLVLVVFALASAALWWRRSHPLQVVGAGVASMLVLLGSGWADTGGVALLGLYAIGRYTADERRGRLAVAAVAVVLVLDGSTENLSWVEVVLTVAVGVGAWVFGRERRLRAEAAARLAEDRAADRRRVVEEERTRIARELHDVVAHRVSLMTVQAGAAVAVAEHDPAAARRAMSAVEEAGRQALDELRQLLGVLRPEVDGGDRGPQPGLADLRRLAERVRAAGPLLELDLDVPDDLPAPVQLSAYRIVQEALTNVVRHAGDGVGVRVALHVAGDRLVVEVRDDGGGPARTGSQRPAGSAADGSRAAGRPGGGHGLVGMRERATLLGGSLEAGPAGDHGFRVVAELPVDPAVDRAAGGAADRGSGDASDRGPGDALDRDPRTAAGRAGQGRP